MHSGEIIQERYLLEERLGGGGMGEVWRALDQRLQRTVAIKLLAPQFVESPEFLVRFLREAQSIARISHPNVVSILDFGESDETPFLVMEHVPGEPLTETTGTPMAPDKASAIIAQAAEAAGAAHAEGIVHRDIKPANIVITDEGRAKLVDFGIASVENVDRITATGTAIGSPHYISPEQASGATATPRSDVYSLGIVLFELLTGSRPFEGDSVAGVAAAHVEQEPPRPSTLVEGLDSHVEKVVLKCLAKDPEDRFADGRELARALSGDADARTLLVAPPVTPTPAPDATQILPVDDAVSYESDPFEPEATDSPWKAALLGLLIGLVLLALAIGAYILLTGREPPSDSAPATEQREQGGQVRSEDPGGGEEADAGEEPTEEQPAEAPSEEDTGEEDADEGEDQPAEDETVEGDLEVDPEPEGVGPDGEGPPGHDD